MSQTYWRDAAGDEAMQDEHAFVWTAMLETIDIDLGGRRVLDAGCNRGGFLRLLADQCGIAEGFGYAPASGAIEDARRLAGHRPLLDWLDYYYDKKLLLRFSRTAEPSATAAP